MTATSTNLHFHGLTVPPGLSPGRCAEDLDPAGRSAVRIPLPNSRRMSRPDCTGITRTFTASAAAGARRRFRRADHRRASSAPIREVAGLPERVLVIRDQDLVNPNAPPSKSEPVVPKMFIDRDGDSANNGTGFGKPAKDLSINFVPVPYPDYPPAAITDEAGRAPAVARAECLGHHLSESRACCSAATPQQLGIVAIDGVPHESRRRSRRPAVDLGGSHRRATGRSRGIHRRPGRRRECRRCSSPAPSTPARAARTIRTARWPRSSPPADAPEPQLELACQSSTPLPPPGAALAGQMSRRCACASCTSPRSWRIPNNPNSATDFLHHRGRPDTGAVRSRSDDAEHRRSARRRGGLDHREPLHRTARLPHPSAPFHADGLVGHAGQRAISARHGQCAVLQRPGCCNTRACGCAWISAIRTRVGTFVYHCHLLEHEDGGMMGLIRVEPRCRMRPCRRVTNA